MNESAWVACINPWAMLDFLRDSSQLSERKARLFAAAVCRRIWHLLVDERSRRAVEVAEQYAEGLVDAKSLSAAAEAAAEASHGPFDDSPRGQRGAYFHGTMAAWWAVSDARTFDAGEVCDRAFGATVCDPDDPEVEPEAQSALLRDILGSLPFHPLALPPFVRTWNDGCVVKLATAIYQERSLPEGTLDPQRLAVLGDALEEAGCTNTDILGHCRQQGAVHVRGCFVLDLLLGKS